MPRRLLASLTVLAFALPAFGSALGTAARSAIPSDVQQIITVDYRTLNSSPAALALKAQVLPAHLKEFEESLRGAGLDPERDVEQLVFASFRSKENRLQVLGIASGQFELAQLRHNLKKKKIRPRQLRDSDLYPMAGGLEMTLLDEYTLLFGSSSAVKAALDARDGFSRSLNSNSQVTDLMGGVEDSAIWSVLDAEGTRYMVRSALGQAAGLADYDAVKRRLLGSRYVLDFSSGVDFNLDVFTSDSMSAALLSSIMQAGLLYRRMSSSGVERTALENLTVDSESDHLKVRFEADDRRFQSLLHSDLFAAISR